MFEIRSPGRGYYIKEMSGPATKFLHSDGSIYSTVEYFPTKEDAQKILDKFYPKPKHEWEHGDVFETPYKVKMIYLNPLSGSVVLSVSCRCSGNCTVRHNLDDAKFLFNIKEKL